MLAAALSVWLLLESHAPHPGYLSYFNKGRRRRQRRSGLLLDSDLDWGQDLYRLQRVLRERGVQQLHIAYFGPAVLSRHALPKTMPLSRGQPASGW